MTSYVKDEILIKKWINELNLAWKSFCEESRLKNLIIANEETVDFLNEMTFKNVEYSQIEAGLVYESSTVRKFDLQFIYRGELYEIGAVELLGEGPSEWYLEPYIEFDDNEHIDYTIKSETDTTFSEQFGLEVSHETIQEIFGDFHLFQRCENFERRLLDSDANRVSNELLEFFQKNKVKNVYYSSRGMTIVTEGGATKEFILDPNHYLNHFN